MKKALILKNKLDKENADVKEELTSSPNFIELRRNMRKSIREFAEVYMDGEWVRTYGATNFADIVSAENAEETSNMVRKRSSQLVEMIFDIVWSSSITEKIPAFEALFAEFIAIASTLFAQTDLENPVVESFNANLAELEDVDFEGNIPEAMLHSLSEGEIETVANILNDVADGKISAERAPLFANVTLLEAGWGNPSDNNYYPKEMLEKYGDKFIGAKMYETDHDETNRSTANWVSTSTSNIGMSEGGGLVHRVFIHDGDFAERMRNLKRGGLLESMECSILASGLVEKKKFKDAEGREGRRVTSIESVSSVDWVTRAGAGGKAMDLIETHGGTKMSKQAELKKLIKQVIAEESTEVAEEVTIRENDDAEVVSDPQPEATPKVEVEGDGNGGKDEMLSQGEVDILVDSTNLHELTKERLKKGEYKSLTALGEIVKATIEEVKSLTGSGAPFGASEISEESDEETSIVEGLSDEDYEAKMKELDSSLGLN